MSSRESPFIYEDAVPPQKFFDRHEEVELLVRNLRTKRKMLLCIVAPLKYGKSSLMYKYLDLLRKHEDIIPVYVNLKEIERPLRYIVSALVGYGIDLRKHYEKALRGAELVLLFNALDGALKEKDKWLFLLFDEFHLLPQLVRNEGFFQGLDDNVIFGFFRGFAEGRRISYIVCGSVIEPLMRALDIWGGRFETIYLGPFPEDDAVNMLKSLFAEGAMPISEAVARHIAEAAGYHPFYMQYMGHQIYASGRIDRATIRQAKQKLYNYVIPIFITYIEKIYGLGRGYLETLAKIIRKEDLSIDDMPRISTLVRMGILRPKNSEFEIIDPLFERYLQQITQNLKPTEVVIVGHWAERIVGNYLLKKGYTPYYSHDSRGAFDIYVRIGTSDVGIQVKYSTKGEIHLSQEEAEKIKQSANENGWIPLLALVEKQIKFYPNIQPGKYNINQGYAEIEEAIRQIKAQPHHNQ